ncbi:BLUF domain-containing protein [Pedobacter sp. MR2016-24]|uniref:BLUF domain-containing protein n=1 Tax=Pedobacter sp. MR2016-24 TaxID=2994466 RepID=UPI003A4E083F
MELLHYVIYISKAGKLLTEEELIDLLEESRAWNLSHGITGMLMYLEGNFLHLFEGRFIQVLKGSSDEVTAIF